MTTPANPTWTRWPEAARVILHPPHLRKTLFTALCVGTILFAINHLDEVLRGRATPATWIKGAVTYFVPFAVSNIGVLISSRRTAPSQPFSS